MNTRILLILGLLLGLAGCASCEGERKQAADLRSQLKSVSGKFEVAKKENLNLKKELVLFKSTQGIDSQRFVRALDAFQKDLASEIAQGNAGVLITPRGLVIVIDAEKLFVSGTDVLSDAGKDFLDQIYAGMEERFPTNYVYVEGHTDNQSLAVFEWKSDWEFSFARALSVLKYLTEKKHMDPLRLSASGFGQYRPRATNETKEGRRLNRRIEIIISPQRLKHVLSD
jgi:flagellar motor protein MotB